MQGAGGRRGTPGTLACPGRTFLHPLAHSLTPHSLAAPWVTGTPTMRTVLRDKPWGAEGRGRSLSLPSQGGLPGGGGTRGEGRGTPGGGNRLCSGSGTLGSLCAGEAGPEAVGREAAGEARETGPGAPPPCWEAAALQAVVSVKDGWARPGPRGHPRRPLHPQVLASRWAAGESSEREGQGPRGRRDRAGVRAGSACRVPEGPMRTVGQAVRCTSPAAAASRSVTLVSGGPGAGRDTTTQQSPGALRGVRASVSRLLCGSRDCPGPACRESSSGDCTVPCPSQEPRREGRLLVVPAPSGGATGHLAYCFALSSSSQPKRLRSVDYSLFLKKKKKKLTAESGRG